MPATFAAFETDFCKALFSSPELLVVLADRFECSRCLQCSIIRNNRVINPATFFLLLLHLSFNGGSHVDEFSAGVFVVIVTETLNSKVVRPPIEYQGIVIGLLILWVKPDLF